MCEYFLMIIRTMSADSYILLITMAVIIWYTVETSFLRKQGGSTLENLIAQLELEKKKYKNSITPALSIIVKEYDTNDGDNYRFVVDVINKNITSIAKNVFMAVWYQGYGTHYLYSKDCVDIFGNKQLELWCLSEKRNAETNWSWSDFQNGMEDILPQIISQYENDSCGICVVLFNDVDGEKYVVTREFWQADGPEGEGGTFQCDNGKVQRFTFDKLRQQFALSSVNSPKKQ